MEKDTRRRVVEREGMGTHGQGEGQRWKEEVTQEGRGEGRRGG